MGLDLLLPFVEKIGNQYYYDGDSIYIISIYGMEYKGFLKTVGLSCYIQITNNKTLYECRYLSVNPVKMVLFEKYQKVDTFTFEHL